MTRDTNTVCVNQKVERVICSHVYFKAINARVVDLDSKGFVNF